LIINTLLPIIALSAVIAFHELGHLFAAKLFGIKVEVYSIGIGKKLWSFNSKNTEFALSLLPLGGYCKLKGGDSNNPNLDSDSMDSASPIKKIGIFFAGPLFNIILTSLLLIIIFMLPVHRNIPTTVIPLLGQNLPAEVSGIKMGDRILEIDSRPINNFSDISKTILLKDYPLEVKILRNEEIKNLSITPINSNGRLVIGIYPFIPLKVLSSRNTQIQKGSTITAINGVNTSNYYNMLEEIGNNVDFTISYKNSHGEFTETFTRKILGDLEFLELFSYNPITATLYGFSKTVDMFKQMAKMLADLFKKGEISKSISSPIRLVYDIGTSVDNVYSTGNILFTIETFLTIMASVSLALGFINLFPIPILDGGQILINFIVMIKGSPLKPSITQGYQMVGLLIILLLFVVGISNDIFYLGDL